MALQPRGKDKVPIGPGSCCHGVPNESGIVADSSGEGWGNTSMVEYPTYLFNCKCQVSEIFL